MVTETSVLRYLKVYLGQRFDIESSEFYLEDVIKEITLPTFSRFYPYRINGIVIRQSDAIRTYNPSTRQMGYNKYKIPNHGEDIEYLDIANFYHPYNDKSSNLSCSYGGGNFIASIAASKVMSAVPHVNSVYVVEFEPPDIIIVSPYPMYHVDFTVDMKCVRKLHQIMPMYKDDFMKLALLDVKMALYNRYINLRSSGNFGAMELNPGLEDFSSAENDREELLDKMREDSVKYYGNLRDYFNKINY